NTDRRRPRAARGAGSRDGLRGRCIDRPLAVPAPDRAQDYAARLKTAPILAHTPKPSQPGIAVVSHSGGISSLTADMCGQAGLDLPPLSDQARDGINSVIKDFGWAANPSDVTGYANSESFPHIMDCMLNEPQMGTLVIASAGSDTQAEQVISLRNRSDQGMVFLWSGSR